MQSLTEALAVTAELTGTELSKAAARVMADDLGRFPLNQVLAALTRCRRELKGKLTIASVIERLDDGRPGVEEAWAMIPKSEYDTAVWTQEMASAFGVALPLMDSDEVAARMAFKEAYARGLSEARNEGTPVRWTVTLGHDASAREGVLMRAVEQGKISAQHAANLVPQLAYSESFQELLLKGQEALRLGLREDRT